MQRQKLTKADQRRLHAAQARLEKAEGDLTKTRAAWADLVRELGQAACARELDLTPQAVYERLRSWKR